MLVIHDFDQSETVHYAHVDLGGCTYAFKKRFLKWVENDHSYYMPDHSGMCDGPYHEVDADHWVHIKITDLKVFYTVLEVLLRRYKCNPRIYPVRKTDIPYGRQKTYEQMTYKTREYIGQEFYPGLWEA